MKLRKRIRREIERCERLANEYAHRFARDPKERDVDRAGDNRSAACGYFMAVKVLKGLLAADAEGKAPPRSA
jgi:hypothetical protein